MKTCFSNWRRAVLLIFVVCSALPARAGSFQLSSAIGSSGSPAGGGGDSTSPIISADGRYVLFASPANNLMLNTNGNPIPALIPPSLNVFLRDRTNGTTTLISVNLSGTGGGNGNSIPMEISTNGQYVLFESSASDLVPNDTNGVSDIFVRDIVNGTNMLVSIGTNGGCANGVSRSSAMTQDGHYVAFVSAATNLVTGDSNKIPDIFVRDLQGGTTTLASVGAVSAIPTPFPSSSEINSSESPGITPDGRYVVFYSTATNLVSGVTKIGEIYVRDLVGGTTIWASTDARTIMQSVMGITSAVSYNHVISDDGQFVAYEASPTNVTVSPVGIILRYCLVTGLTDIVNTNARGVATGNELNVRNLDMTPDGRFIAFVGNTNNTLTTCIFAWNATNNTTTLVSGGLDGSVQTNSICDWPALDPNGRFVAFISSATNLVANSLAGDYHLYMRDTQAGVTTLVDAGTNGVGPGVSPATFPRMSANAHYVAFEGPGGNLMPNGNNHTYDVFVRDLTTNTIELISAHDPTLPSLSPNGPSGISTFSISPNGRYIAFASEADNLVGNDTNGFRDVFVRDLLAGTNVLVSVATNGMSGGGASTDSAISADGRYVAFTSSASNLVANDNNNQQDVFLRDLQAGTTVLVSVRSDGIHPGSTPLGFSPPGSYSPMISTNGRYVLFHSTANNLISGYSASGENLYWRDMQSGMTNMQSARTNVVNYPNNAGTYPASMTPDGRYVAFAASSLVRVWDSQSTNMFGYIYAINASAGIKCVGISPDGNRLAYQNSQLYVADLAANTNWAIASWSASPSRARLRFSSDGRFLTYVAFVSNTNQIYLYDFQAGTNFLVSRSFNSTNAANGPSDSPDISADGRFVAYRSAATDIISGVSNGVPNIFLYDRLADANMLMSVSRYGYGAGDNRSQSPVFSGDGQTLFLQSWASDIAANDFNHNSDIFSFKLYSTAWIVSSAISSGQPLKIIWTVAPGYTYRVQYKDNLTDPVWLDLNGTTTVISDNEYVTDLAPNPNQRFYRIIGN